MSIDELIDSDSEIDPRTILSIEWFPTQESALNFEKEQKLKTKQEKESNSKYCLIKVRCFDLLLCVYFFL